MSQTLLIPIHVDALCLEENQPALDTMADYSQLPYTYAGSSHGATSLNPNLSEYILAPLFNQGWELKAGLHLHWSLPDALTNGSHTEAGTTFPAVPNRWLVLRQGGNQGEKKWIIESDYLHPEETDPNAVDAINILVEPPDLASVDLENPATYQYQRYRCMGQSWDLEAWQAEAEVKEYAPALTAIGTQRTIPIYDEVKATFSAFYPNCYSVFGLLDLDYQTSTPPADLQYDIIGYYSDEQQDFLTLFLEENKDESYEKLLELLQEEFYLTFDSLQDSQDFPKRSLCHARVTFNGSGSGGVNTISPPETVAVADSAPEALAAHLAYAFNAETTEAGQVIRKEVEDKIQALQLLEKLESRKLDVNAKFLEGLHEREFGLQHEGYLWTLLPQVSPEQKLSTKPLSQQRIPSDLAETLNELNSLQEAYHQAWLNIESMRRQLYSQWYYFMKYPEEDGGNFYDTINETSLIPLRAAIAQTGELDFTQSGNGQVTVTAKPLPFGIVSQLNEYFSYYVSIMQDAAGGTYSHWDDIQIEFGSCGVTLSDTPTVTTLTEDKAWQIEDQGQTYDVKVEGGIFNIYIPPTDAQLAVQVTHVLHHLGEAIDPEKNSTLAIQYHLRPFPSQHYWRANEPVILLTGDIAKAPLRFEQDDRLRDDEYLECHPLDFDVATIIERLDQLQGLIDSLQPPPGEPSINFITWSEQPWNPFAFHWSVLAYPCRDSDGSGVKDYHPDQILENYSLEPNAMDLHLKPGKESSFVENSNSYTGYSLLSPSVGSDLSERITDYLNEELLPNYYFTQSIPTEEQTPDYFSENFDQIKDWYYTESGLAGQTEVEQVKDPIFVCLWAYEEMQTLDCQAQSIGGFNETLLLAQPTLQLAVDDPKSMDPVAKLFHEQVRWTLGDSLQYKFLDGDIFNPIRSGALSINRLWLVDSFGQHKEVIEGDIDPTIRTTYRRTPVDTGVYNKVLLAPRLAQPARLNFHWLAADALHEIEMTKAPAKNPVCGWFVPNNLDSNLAVYDHLGKSLGAIDIAGNWRDAPGVTLDRDANRRPLLSNHHLQKMVHYLLEQGIDFQQQFLSTVEKTLETIDPESYAEHPSLALLIGRPIVLVRATFSLEVRGLPGWDPTIKLESTEQELTRNGFEQVKIPIRLGDYQQLNDGLVGYWRETPVGTEGDYDYEGNIFYATQSRLVENNDIQTEAEGLVYFEQTVDAAPQTVTMLMDPRAIVHTTCGILPNQELRLPPENYNQALQAIEVNFLSTPVLCNQEEIAIPLSQEPGSIWSWLSLVNDNWSEKSEIKPVDFTASFSKPQQASEGWLQLSRLDPEDT